ncbi:MAG: DUF1080 domain-containing protein [Planctomycetota bacterium]
MSLASTRTPASPRNHRRSHRPRSNGAEICRTVAYSLAALALLLAASDAAFAQTAPEAKPVAKPAANAEGWLPLFNGRNLEGWKLTKFGGDGEVEVVEGELILNQGGPLTGVTWTKAFPKVDFEISLEAQRVEGTDFFVGLTFPVRDSHASLIVGGWAGSVVGISSLDGRDASENETTQVMKFDNGKWYKFRVRVTADRIKAWIDEAAVVDVSIKDRKVTTRNEVTLSQPVGLATYDTKAAIRKLQYRVIKP